jgi:threonylcarbamoyladenosine tRNA methylthiotransferase MtaB
MRRRYKREIFAGRVEKIRNVLPLAGIGADIIVGFPGESESDFEDTLIFLKQMSISYLHVFKYSERPDTPAGTLPFKVPHFEKERRSKILINLSNDKHLHFSEVNTGQITSVLFERAKYEGMITGFTDNYIRVEYPWQSRLGGKVKKVRIAGMAKSGRMTIEFLS